MWPNLRRAGAPAAPPLPAHIARPSTHPPGKSAPAPGNQSVMWPRVCPGVSNTRISWPPNAQTSPSPTCEHCDYTNGFQGRQARVRGSPPPPGSQPRPGRARARPARGGGPPARRCRGCARRPPWGRRSGGRPVGYRVMRRFGWQIKITSSLGSRKYGAVAYRCIIHTGKSRRSAHLVTHGPVHSARAPGGPGSAS